MLLPTASTACFYFKFHTHLVRGAYEAVLNGVVVRLVIRNYKTVVRSLLKHLFDWNYLDSLGIEIQLVALNNLVLIEDVFPGCRRVADR